MICLKKNTQYTNVDNHDNLHNEDDWEFFFYLLRAVGIKMTTMA